MTKEEWDILQNSKKKQYKYVPTGNAGEVKKIEITEDSEVENDDKDKKKKNNKDLSSMPLASDNTYVRKRNASEEEAAPYFKDSKVDLKLGNEFLNESKSKLLIEGSQAQEKAKRLSKMYLDNAYSNRKKADDIRKKQ